MSKRVAFGFFLAFMLSFGALFWSSWIFFEDYVANPKTVPASIAALLGADGSAAALWPGLAVFLQNLLIFARWDRDLLCVVSCALLLMILMLQRSF